MQKVVLLVVLLVSTACALDNGLALTPQMAWNSWNAIACHINESIIMEMANAVINSGLHKFGYVYVNMDDCWAKYRNSSGYIQPDPVAFPHGIKYLADYVHSLGLKFGLYSDAGNETCAGRPGSLNYETKDAEQYASWGVDYLKYDNCYNEGLPDQQRYTTMRNALNATGRQIFFSLCDWSINTAPWGVYTGNSWRTTTDIQAYFESWINNLDQNNIVAQYAAPGGWNDPDMLEVGNGNLTPNQNTAHCSLWALVKAPLVLGKDLRFITPSLLQVITNQEVLDVSQDPLGQQGIKLQYYKADNGSVWGTVVYADACDGSPAQQFKYTTTGFVMSELAGWCLGQFTPVWNCNRTGATPGGLLYLQPCNQACFGNLQKFNFTKNTWTTNFNVSGTLCMQTLPMRTGQSEVVALGCTGDASQTWSYVNGTIQNNGQCLTVSSGAEIWASKLSNGTFAVGLFNRAPVAQDISVEWSTVGISGAADVRDLWAHKDLGTFDSSFTSYVGAQGISFLKVTPQ